MTLRNLTDEIANLGIREKLINFSAAGLSIYTLNGLNIDSYPVLFQSPTGDHYVSDGTTSYEITLYYFDRLLRDKDNDIQILSIAIEQLRNLIMKIPALEGVLKVEDGYRIRNFSDDQSFNDAVAGAYATIRILTANEYCPE